MKKLLYILILSLLIINPSYSKVGKGELKMSFEMLEYFKKYLRNEYATTFLISEDGKFALYGICGAKRCSGGPGHTGTMMKNCKKVYGTKCYIFSQRKNKKKIIRWNKVDYIFPNGQWNYNEMVKANSLTSKNKGIKKDISDDEIVKILSELGFVDQKQKSGSNESETPSDNIVSKLEKLFDLHKSGALNKEEFQMAKNILLNSES